MDLVFILFLFYFYFILFLVFILLSFILDLGEECDVTSRFFSSYHHLAW